MPLVIAVYATIRLTIYRFLYEHFIYVDF